MTEYRLRWTETAGQDLRAIIEYIAAENPQAALAVLDRIEHRATDLARQPGRGRIVPELRHAGVLHYRESILAPWRIIYRIGEDEVFVLAVLDGRRDLETLLLERLARPPE